jgi:predicted CXXCH cytochrome family protein
MSGDTKISIVLGACTAVFLALGASFLIASRSSPAPPPAHPLREREQVAEYAGTVRISAESMLKSGGDASALDCYACHDEKKTPQIPRDATGRVILPKDHADLIFSMRNCVSCHSGSKAVKLEIDGDGNTIIPPAHAGDLVLAHGKADHNNNACFNCHDPKKLNELVTRDGTRLKLSEATMLCASCHGPTYRDWDAGMHGRTTGHWRRELGGFVRESCTSCHDPHAPAFPALIPRPGPRPAPNAPAARSH